MKYASATRIAWRVAFAAFFLVTLARSVRAQTTDADRLHGYLQSRVNARPDDASSWRLLGAFLLQHQDATGAAQALERAVAIEPDSAASHFDLARSLNALGRFTEASGHFQEAALLAPDSEYAQQAISFASSLPQSTLVVPTGYEIKRFDGSETTEEITESAEMAVIATPLHVKVDLGALYNSNVTLTPVSREFGTTSQPSAQAVFNPFVEYRVVNNSTWGVGPSFAGYFNINEASTLSSLNLQSYQPGVFVEYTHVTANATYVPKVAYTFTMDDFDGARFGERHAFTNSVTRFADSGGVSTAYWTTDFTNFTDDGTTPATDSRDGWTHTCGASHSFPMGYHYLSSIVIGFDLQYADVDGVNYGYFGGGGYVGATICLADNLVAEWEGGVGARDYFRAVVTPSRNETIWRGSAKLTYTFSSSWSVASILSYDRFDCVNDLYQADRYIAGLIASYEY